MLLAGGGAIVGGTGPPAVARDESAGGRRIPSAHRRDGIDVRDTPAAAGGKGATMKLRFNTASPFARKVRIVARETGTIERIEEVSTIVSPVAANADLACENPLVKIPVLTTDDGATLFDSRVICEYLDSLHCGRKLFPAAGEDRYQALRRQALADGILDAAVLCRYEIAVRPEALRWSDWIAGQKAKIIGGLDALEREANTWRDEFDIGLIAVASVPGYLDLRFDEWQWRAARPHLAAWFDKISERPSMVATRHS
jgi:glutathione S-transferase